MAKTLIDDVIDQVQASCVKSRSKAYLTKMLSACLIHPEEKGDNSFISHKMDDTVP